MDRRWLVTGASGKLGGHVVRELVAVEASLGAAVMTTSRKVRADARHRAADLPVAGEVSNLLRVTRPTHIVHLAGMSSVEEAAANPRRAWQANTEVALRLARHAEENGSWLLLASSDFVFDGTLGRRYREGDEPCPQTVYGMTKVAAERAVLERGGAVARMSLLYGWPVDPRVRSTFTSHVEDMARSRTVRVVVDEWRTPLALGDAARVLVALGQVHYRGVVHVGGPERLTAADLAARCAELLGLRPRFEFVGRNSLGRARRPADVSLDSGRLGDLLPALLPGPVRDALLRDGGPPADAQPLGEPQPGVPPRQRAGA